MLQTVIFDMDGVIVDTEPVHHYAYFEHFKELNIEVSAEMFATFTGNSTKNVFQKIKDNFGITTDTEILVQRKRTIFNEAFDTKEDLFLLEGVEDLINSTIIFEVIDSYALQFEELMKFEHEIRNIDNTNHKISDFNNFNLLLELHKRRVDNFTYANVRYKIFI